MKQTKIVCTISDQHCEQDFLRHLFFAGMNVVRMNTAHATPEGIRKIIRNTAAIPTRRRPTTTCASRAPALPTT